MNHEQNIHSELNPDPALSRLLDMVGQAERDSAPAGMEARIAAASRPVSGRMTDESNSPMLRLTDAPAVVPQRLAVRVLSRLAIAAAIGLAAVATWFASRPTTQSQLAQTPHDTNPVPTTDDTSADFLLTVAFGTDSERDELADLSSETDALRARVKTSYSPADVFLVDSSS